MGDASRATELRRLVALLVLLTALFYATSGRAQILSPGPLSKAHTSLEGDQHCNACHSSGRQVEQTGCFKCHGNLAARINAGLGLHGRQYKGQPCANCHVEHRGGGGLMRWPGGDPTKLDHAQTGWPLEGAHKATTCAKCHAKTNERGNPTFLGLSSACASCHKDPHQARFGATCTSCHEQASWKAVSMKSFNHDLARFPLRGAHGSVACAKCHSEPPKWVGLKFEACTDCHKDPHAGKLGAACTSCHEDTRWKPVTQKIGARHPGVSLANGHAAVPCKSCHDRGNLAAPSRGQECASCHKPVHKAPFGRACGSCHGSIQWVGLPRAVGLAAHVRTEFPLTGKHDGTACAGCHKPEVPREARYRGLASGRCVDCHADQHRGEFGARAPTTRSGDKAGGGECSTCHGTNGFRPTSFGVAEHAATAFPLTGKHVATACSGCHGSTRPRLDLHLAKKACADCHANPHGEQFVKEMAQGGCAHCHEANGWGLPKIDHRTWPLTGAHATASCEGCHRPTPEDKKSGRGTSYRGVPRACSGCHDDVHLGQFRLAAPAYECDRCHATTVFKIASFDHGALTAWPLTGAHATVDCTKCHAKAKLKDGSEATRFRLPSHECSYCHANPHQARAGK
jgi:hypothetical protein